VKPKTEVKEGAVLALLASTTLGDLDRALLFATAHCEGLRAVELWRCHGSMWLPVLARGPRELLPSEALVRAAVEGVIEGQLPCGAQVLAHQGKLALVLAWSDPEACDDRAIAWLSLHASIAATLPEDGTPFSAALPRRDD